MFHINPKTGDAGLCRAKQGNCPFGGAEEHYLTKDDARMAYEAGQKPFPKIVKVKFYRSGELTKLPSTLPKLDEIVGLFDQFKPEGVVGRTEGLFATASVDDMARWVAANDSTRAPYSPQEITYQGPEPLVYPIHAYEAAMVYVENFLMQPTNPRAEEKCRQAVGSYWSSGIPLDEFLENKDRIVNDQEWSPGSANDYEILFDPQHIVSARKVGWNRLIASVDNEGDQARFKQLQRKEKWEKPQTGLSQISSKS